MRRSRPRPNTRTRRSADTIGGVKDRPEDLLDVLDVFADADLRAGLGPDVRRSGQMVGMGVSLQRPAPLTRARARLGGAMLLDLLDRRRRRRQFFFAELLLADSGSGRRWSSGGRGD
jgi:hypothetical protein